MGELIATADQFAMENVKEVIEKASARFSWMQIVSMDFENLKEMDELKVLESLQKEKHFKHQFFNVHSWESEEKKAKDFEKLVCFAKKKQSDDMLVVLKKLIPVVRYERDVRSEFGPIRILLKWFKDRIEVEIE